jgi:DNA-binding GntR family transcriptional regulator
MPKKATAQETALKSVRKMLASGKLKPGQQIIQDALASRLGVSRVPVREALKTLQAEGRVIHDPHRGYFVASLSVEDLTEIYHLRSILEDEALRVGIPNVSPADIAAIKGFHEEGIVATNKGDINQMAALNRKFHMAIYRLCNQERLITMIENLWDSLDAYRVLFLSDLSNCDRTNEDHARMIQLLKQKDVKESLKIQAVHLNHALKAIKAQLITNSETD